MLFNRKVRLTEREDASMNHLFLATAAVDAARQAAGRTENQAHTGQHQAIGGLRSKLEGVGNDVERLFIITEALWTLLKEVNGLTDADLEHMIEEIDLRSGKRDGKRAKQERPLCPSCQRRNSGRMPTCMYCGVALTIEPFAKF